MNPTGGITPWPGANTTRPLSPVTAKNAPREVEERLMLARLFGQPVTPQPATASPAAPATQGNDDEFAPHLGRYLDVTA